MDNLCLGGILRQSPGPAFPCPAIDIDLAAISYTSGCTGKPKGVMLSHLNLASNTRSIVAYLGLTPEDRAMAVLPPIKNPKWIEFRRDLPRNEAGKVLKAALREPGG